MSRFIYDPSKKKCVEISERKPAKLRDGLSSPYEQEIQNQIQNKRNGTDYSHERWKAEKSGNPLVNYP